MLALVVGCWRFRVWYPPRARTLFQAKSNGLLEVTVLISGEHRKRNIPGAAFRKGAGKFLAKAGFVSPAAASPANSFRAMPSGRRVIFICSFFFFRHFENQRSRAAFSAW